MPNAQRLTPVDWQISRFPILASTNDLALDWMRSGRARAGDVLVTDEQTAGRGRPGRAWHSARGALLMTAVLPFLPERVGWTALAAGIAVARAVREMGVPARVKWPNDVLLEGRKLGGILVETSAPDLAAIGIGLNVANPLPPDGSVRVPAARLADTLPHVTPEIALQAMLAHLLDAWRILLSEDLSPLREAWAELDTTAGRLVQWSIGSVAGTAEGVDAGGALLIRTDDGRLVSATSGEVTFCEVAG